LKEVISNMLLGGRDTTAVTLTWAFYEIARHPEVEARLQAEASNIPMDDVEEFYKALKVMHYTEAVVRETVRLHAPVPVDAKIAKSEDVLPDGTFVDRGCTVIYCPWAMAKDPDLWGADAGVWRPERWFDGDVAKEEPSPFIFSSFQAGPRICLGKDLAILEAKAVIATLFHAGAVMRLWPTMKEPQYEMGFTLQVEEPGMLMKVTFDE